LADLPQFLAAHAKQEPRDIGRIGKFVRSQSDQVGVDLQLNLHGSRYTFRTLARDVQLPITKEIIDATVGHAPNTQGGLYSGVSLHTKFVAISRIIRCCRGPTRVDQGLYRVGSDYR
jgi:hypothetical protein